MSNAISKLVKDKYKAIDVFHSILDLFHNSFLIQLNVVDSSN